MGESVKGAVWDNGRVPILAAGVNKINSRTAIQTASASEGSRLLFLETTSFWLLMVIGGWWLVVGG